MRSIKSCPVLRRHLGCVALALMTAVPAAWAAEVSYDFVACTSGRSNLLFGSAEFVATGDESFGVVASSTTKEWAGATTHCVGSMRLIAGNPAGSGFCKWVQMTGDTAVGQYWFGDGKQTWTWLHGTGKLAGISGGGTFKYLFRGKPVEAGTSQSCRQDWGKYTLP